MSIGSLGGVSSLAATPTSQRSSDVEKTQTATAEKSRVDAAAEYAEQASGIGETKEESESSDRDADGRRVWELGEEKKKAAEQPTEQQAAGQSIDPTGERGGALDLTG
jgi:hypothetical protein